MWIERIAFSGFGNILNETIEFESTRLDLVVEPNEYGKSTMACAIWATLFDFPVESPPPGRLSEKEWRRPRSQSAPFRVDMDIVANGKKLRVTRDFGAGSLHVVDRESDEDVTDQFGGPEGHDELGLKLTGMTRELFRSTCFVGQRELDRHTISGDSTLTTMLQSIADSASSSGNSGSAVSAIQDVLSRFPYKGSTMRVDLAIRNLETERADIAERLKRLEDERQKMTIDLMRLSEIDTMGSTNGQETVVSFQSSENQPSNEYARLYEEAAELDNKLNQAQERLNKLSQLQQDIAQYGIPESFPIQSQRYLEELWTRRQSHMTEYERLARDIDPKAEESSNREKEIRERWADLTGFTPEDSQAMALLVLNFQNLSKELSEMRTKRDAEARKVQSEQIDLSKLESARRSLTAIDGKEADDARSYDALINAAREQITECERAVFKARASIIEVTEQRKMQTGKDRIFAGVALLFLIGTVVAHVFVKGMGAAQFVLSLAVVVVALFGVGFLGWRVWKPDYFRKRDIELAEHEINRQTNLAGELRNKIVSLEMRLDSLAKKAGISNGADLLLQLNDYAATSAKTKDLDAIEQKVSMKESQLAKVRLDLEGYFVRAGKSPRDLTLEDAQGLSKEITAYSEEYRALASLATTLNQTRNQMNFLVNEIMDTEAQLRELFGQAKMTAPNDLELSYEEYMQKAASYQQWLSLSDEIKRVQFDPMAEADKADLPSTIMDLEARRERTHTRMREILERNPEVLDPSSSSRSRSVTALAEKELPAELKQERNEIVMRVRAAAQNYDENYLLYWENLAAADRELDRVRRAKAALELARDTLRKVSGEVYVDWAGNLNNIASEMLKDVGMEYEDLRFEQDMSLTARRKGESERLGPDQFMKQLSLGTKEQLHWLARMVVSRYLSNDNALPIILDEPFSESDDDRFLRIMKFILSTLIPQHQIIIYSCHQMRHQWLMEQLPADLKERIAFCKRQTGSARYLRHTKATD